MLQQLSVHTFAVSILALSLVAVLADDFFVFVFYLWEVHYSALSCFGERFGTV